MGGIKGSMRCPLFIGEFSPPRHYLFSSLSEKCSSSQVFMRLLLVILIALTGVGLGYGLARIAAAKRATKTLGLATQEKVADVQTLREKARQVKHYVGYQAPSKLGAFTDLAGLVNNSSAVIVGIPQDNISTLFLLCLLMAEASR
jgi:hypothetical protein